MKQPVKPYTNNSKTITREELHAWEDLYENYAGIMYGCILKITGCEIVAEQLFKKAFLGLSEIQLPAQKINSSFILWKYAGKIALDYLKNNNLPLEENNISPYARYPVLEILCLHDQSITQSAKTYAISEKKLKEKLHTGFSGSVYTK